MEPAPRIKRKPAFLEEENITEIHFRNILIHFNTLGD